eukprot:1545218-Pyramimonas_sp.AAC.1
MTAGTGWWRSTGAPWTTSVLNFEVYWGGMLRLKVQGGVGDLKHQIHQQEQVLTSGEVKLMEAAAFCR